MAAPTALLAPPATAPKRAVFFTLNLLAAAVALSKARSALEASPLILTVRMLVLAMLQFLQFLIFLRK